MNGEAICDAPSLRESDQPGFYVLSLKWSNNGKFTWWGPNNAGYTQNLASAGVYSAAQIAAARDYYDNGRDTLAIPVGAAERASHTVREVHGGRRNYQRLRRARNRAMALVSARKDGSSLQKEHGDD